MGHRAEPEVPPFRLQQYCRAVPAAAVILFIAVSAPCWQCHLLLVHLRQAAGMGCDSRLHSTGGARVAYVGLDHLHLEEALVGAVYERGDVDLTSFKEAQLVRSMSSGQRELLLSGGTALLNPVETARAEVARTPHSSC